LKITGLNDLSFSLFFGQGDLLTAAPAQHSIGYLYAWLVALFRSNYKLDRARD
jgi:hypothetical protein